VLLVLEVLEVRGALRDLYLLEALQVLTFREDVSSST
jgi:hypothetical protein